jgi:NAD(P)-dependent dehydrogenase (short-subunit alcohol dehydrogenase family)
MAEDRKRLLITGANRGIGLEFAHQYARAGWRVYATCRRPERALDLNRLAAIRQGSVTVHPLDVTEHTHIESLKAILTGVPLDLLVNNAGVLGPPAQGFGHTDEEAWMYTLRVNTIAPLKLIEAFADNLAAAGGVVANLSSKMGSIADNSSGGYYLYRSSKAALNAAVRSAALDLRPRGVTVVSLHPGWVRTAMGGPDAEIDAVESVSRLRRVLAGIGPAHSGGFLDNDGSVIAW